MTINLRLARVSKNKTQWDLRHATGIHQTKISLIENNYVLPTDDEKQKIARALGLTVEQIDWDAPEKHNDF